MSLDGGDAMKVLYRYFTGKKGAKDYFSYFQRITGRRQLSPVILLYDNETENKKPLKAFLNEDAGITELQKQELKNNLQLRLLPDSTLFLLITPLTAGKAECEIEDLFAPDLLELTLDGKLSRAKINTMAKKFFPSMSSPTINLLIFKDSFLCWMH